MNFKEWLLKEDAGSPGAKQALYPMGYGGIGLYPPSDVVTWAADAVTYMPTKMRQLTFIWGDGILSNPFDKNDLYNSIKGKEAQQLQAGNLKVDNEGFEKISNFANYYNSIRKIQAGSLNVGGSGFEKSDNFIAKLPNKPGLYDYKQIGDVSVKYILPIRKNP